MSRSYAIGDISRLTGVKVTTIRYYEQNGLMAEPERAASGHRRYDEMALERLGFIRQARELGFDLSSIRELLDLAADPDRPCVAVDTIAQRHMDAIACKIARLTALKGELERVLHACASERVGDCRVLESIAGHNSPE
ncbi:MAG: helix-turn-helix domain-containing protein [Oceanicaulis sp.]